MPVILHMLMQAALGAWAAHQHARVAGPSTQRTAPYALAVAAFAAAVWLVPTTTAQYLMAPDYAWCYLIDPLATPMALAPSSATAAILPMLAMGLGFRASMACAGRPKAYAALGAGGLLVLGIVASLLGTEPLAHLGSYEQYWAHEAPALYRHPWLGAVALAYGLWVLTYRALATRMVQWLA